jgi:hypothetical protein
LEGKTDGASSGGPEDIPVPRDVDDYLRVWEELRESGRPATPAELCAGRPDILAELLRRVALLQACDNLLAPGSPHDEAGGGGIPSAVAGYEVVDKLGHGGAGVVYRVWDPLLLREGALKMLHTSGSGRRRRTPRDS